MALIQKEYSDCFQNAARQARIAAILAENPDWEDPTFNKETMDRYDKNREAFSGGGKKFVKEQNKVGKLKLPGIFGN